MNDRDHDPLAPLAEVPPPRRTDDAFARSVQEGVRARRGQSWRAMFAVPALAAAAAGFAFLVMRPPAVEETMPVVAIGTTTTTTPAADIAIVDPFDDEDALFALPMLDGSSDDELARLDRMLDQKLSAQTQRGER